MYAYDQGGNILSKTAYAYTTGTVGTVVKTDTYTYGDANWKDKLTAFNGTTINYDAIGNPTSDGTWTYTWEKGRQLKSMSKSGETATFTYNADGLRLKKVCTTTGTTSYTLHGKNVVHLSNNGNNLHFFYDAQNRPAVVVFNGVAYGYVHNLQGDIIAIVNSAGTKVVEYTYDAWGKPLSKSGSMANTLGTLNPFRYRGYVFDEETALYYLRSRYYHSLQERFVNTDANGGYLTQIMSHNAFIYCLNTPVTRADYTGCSSDDAIATPSDLVAKVIKIAAGLENTNASENVRLVGSSLIFQGKSYIINKLPADKPTWESHPTSIAKGYGYARTLSPGKLGQTFATHDFETMGYAYIFFNAVVTTCVEVSIFQKGTAEPEARVWVWFVNSSADTSQGVHRQQILSSPKYRVTHADGQSYTLVDPNGTTYVRDDTENWINNALNQIKWE